MLSTFLQGSNTMNGSVSKLYFNTQVVRSSTVPTMASTQEETALAFLRTFETLDLKTNLALRTDDCRHDMAPASMGFPSGKTNEQFAEHFNRVTSLMSAFPVTPKEIFAHDGSNQVTIWATSNAIFREEVKGDDATVDWTYQGEYMFNLFFETGSTKIKRIIEFIDSQRVAQVMGLIERARHNLELRSKST